MIKPPPDSKRCTYIYKKGKSAGERCPNAKQKGRDFCNMHPPERARELGSKGGKANAARLAKIKAIVELGKQAAIGKTWDEKLDYYAGRIVSEKNVNVRLAYEKLHHQAMDARAKYKSGDKKVFVIMESDRAGNTRWPEKDGPRPTPTPFDGEEQKFVVPKEG